MRAPHVVIVVENLPVPFDRRVWMEARALRDYGYKVSVICPTGKGFNTEDEVLENVRILRHELREASMKVDYIREYAAALWHESRLLARLRREGPIDVIQICNPPDLLFLAALPHKFLYGTRVVFDHHDINPELFEVKFGRRGVFYWLLRIAERLTFSVADVVLATNESYRDIAVGRGRVNPSRVYIVKSAPDLLEYTAPPSSGQEAADGCLVGYVGIMAAQDGVDTLIEAAAILLGRVSPNVVRFRIIGGGSEEMNLRRRARELGVADSIDFTGYLYGAEMRGSLSECDLGVVPDPKNPYNDKCTMNKVLEYMALGVPVVQFDLLESRRSAGDAAEYADGNDAGALAAAIEAVCFDAARLRQMRQAGLKRIAEQQWAVQRASLAAAYDCASEAALSPR